MGQKIWAASRRTLVITYDVFEVTNVHSYHKAELIHTCIKCSFLYFLERHQVVSPLDTSYKFILPIFFQKLAIETT